MDLWSIASATDCAGLPVLDRPPKLWSTAFCSFFQKNREAVSMRALKSLWEAVEPLECVSLGLKGNFPQNKPHYSTYHPWGVKPCSASNSQTHHGTTSCWSQVRKIQRSREWWSAYADVVLSYLQTFLNYHTESNQASFWWCHKERLTHPRSGHLSLKNSIKKIQDSFHWQGLEAKVPEDHTLDS